MARLPSDKSLIHMMAVRIKYLTSGWPHGEPKRQTKARMCSDGWTECSSGINYFWAWLDTMRKSNSYFFVFLGSVRSLESSIKTLRRVSDYLRISASTLSSCSISEEVSSFRWNTQKVPKKFFLQSSNFLKPLFRCLTTVPTKQSSTGAAWTERTSRKHSSWFSRSSTGRLFDCYLFVITIFSTAIASPDPPSQFCWIPAPSSLTVFCSWTPFSRLTIHCIKTTDLNLCLPDPHLPWRDYRPMACGRLPASAWICKLQAAARGTCCRRSGGARLSSSDPVWTLKSHV